MVQNQYRTIQNTKRNKEVLAINSFTAISERNLMNEHNCSNSWPDMQYNQHINDILPTVPPPLLAPVHEIRAGSRWQIEFRFEETKVPAFGSDLPVFTAGANNLTEQSCKAKGIKTIQGQRLRQEEREK